MKVVIFVHKYAPSVGGVENGTRVIANQFVLEGNEVVILVSTPADGGNIRDVCQVIRGYSVSEAIREIGRCDLIIENGASIRNHFWKPLTNTPWLTVHHNKIGFGQGNRFGRLLKIALLAGGHHFSISHFLKEELGLESKVIPCFFDDRRYGPKSRDERTRDILFVGRLIQDKGIVTLLAACERLGPEILAGGVTILGNGPLIGYVREKKKTLSGRINLEILTGCSDDEVAAEMRKHKILVVPSVKNETFGMVALEGLASGCRVIASRSGGLPEAVGKCGDLITPDDAEALAGAIDHRLRHLAQTPDERDTLTEHLEKYQPSRFVRRCSDIVSRSTAGRPAI